MKSMSMVGTLLATTQAMPKDEARQYIDRYFTDADTGYAEVRELLGTLPHFAKIYTAEAIHLQSSLSRHAEPMEAMVQLNKGVPGSLHRVQRCFARSVRSFDLLRYPNPDCNQGKRSTWTTSLLLSLSCQNGGKSAYLHRASINLRYVGIAPSVCLEVY